MKIKSNHNNVIKKEKHQNSHIQQPNVYKMYPLQLKMLKMETILLWDMEQIYFKHENSIFHWGGKCG